jgi:hypothetical protein
MWKVYFENEEVHACESLVDALEFAKSHSGFVTVSDGYYEFVGKFGYDEVKNGMCPDGVAYDWKMRRDETHRSSRKKLV